MRLNLIAAAVATVAIGSGIGVTHYDMVADTQSARSVSRVAETHSPVKLLSKNVKLHSKPANSALTWLESAGGQAQVTFNDDVDTLAADLETESQSPTVANHLVFEADARAVRAEARKILSTPALLPTVNRAAYERMLKDFIVVANLLQPGPGYGTTAQDYTAWYKALDASNITVW